MMPSGWEMKKLDEVTSLILDGTHFSPKSKTGPYKYITSKNIRFGRMDLSNISYISKEEHESIYKRCPVQYGDLLLTKDGANTGNAALNELEEKFSLLSSVAVIRANPEITSNNFLLQTFLSPKYQTKIKDEMAGQAITRLTLQKIKLFEVVLPPKNEQEKIAKILSTWDEAIEKLSLVIKSKQEFKSCILRDVFNLKKIDLGWKETPLIEVSEKSTKYSFTGGPFGSNLKASDYTDSGIRIIQLQNIGDGFFNDGYRIYTSAKKADELASCNIFPGDLILSKMGDPVARATLIPSIEERYLMASDGIRLKVDEKKFDRDFILEAINSPFFRNKAVSASTGSTRQRIGLGDLKTITLITPETLDEQKAIGRLFVTLNDEIQKTQNTLLLLETQKMGLMQHLLTGKKRVKV
jgi:type I restriction enzyme S subunit